MGYIFDAMKRVPTPSQEKEVAPQPGVSLPPLPAASDESPQAVSQEASTPQALPGPAMPSGEARGKSDDRLVMLNAPSSLMAEEYRAIRTGILARWEQRRHLTHTITSATPQEGKTITSLNLGLCFAELHTRKTIVLECDLRLPQFAKLLNMQPQPGMVDYLDGDIALEKLIHRPAGSELHLIAAGQRAGNETVQLLSSQKMVDLIVTLRQHYDHVIIDTPPVVELADAGILGAMSDDVLLVARMGRTPRTLVEQAIRTLESYNAPVAGLIATDQARPRRRHYYHRYGYHYPQARLAKAA